MPPNEGVERVDPATATAADTPRQQAVPTVHNIDHSTAGSGIQAHAISTGGERTTTTQGQEAVAAAGVRRTNQLGAWAILGLIAVLATATLILEVSGHRQVSQATVRLVANVPSPGRRWNFPAIRGSAMQTVLVFTNKGVASTTVRVRAVPGFGTSPRTVRMPAHGQADLPLSDGMRVSALRVVGSAPIIVERIVVRPHRITTEFGHRLA